LAADGVGAIAIDLPGVGQSTGNTTDGSKHHIAALLHRVRPVMAPTAITVVGHLIGGTIAYPDTRRIVTADVPGPGYRTARRVRCRVPMALTD
jgi:surfactin synthase thioesterase subunit